MLRVVCSPAPALHWQPGSLPEELAATCRRLKEVPRRCLWIVPTSRRRRALLRQAVGGGARAVLLPRIHTFESFVAQALEYSPRAGQRVTGPERLLRIARAWTDVTGRPAQPQFVRQLDRFVRDWQACRLDPAESPDFFVRVVHRFQTDLADDQRFDRMFSIAVLIDELAEPRSWPQRFFFHAIDTVVFDGFHRLERIELELIGTLARQHDVLVWLVATPGQVSEKTTAEAIKYFEDAGFAPGKIDVARRASDPIAEVGRRLFPGAGRAEGVSLLAADPGVATSPTCGVFKLTEATPLEEVEAVARAIKRDYLAARKSGAVLRLSDVAIIIPGPVYDPLIREVFPRAGLEFNLAGRALEVSLSRPARVLSAVLDLVRNQWRHDLLLDFLCLPLVSRRLENRHLLHELFSHRPRTRKRLDHAAWRKSWQAHVSGLHGQIDRWTSGAEDVPERHRDNRQEYLARKKESAASLARLVESIEIVLQPVAAIEQLLDDPPQKDALRELVKRVGDLFRLLAIDTWLQPPFFQSAICNPPSAIPVQPVPWVEYEKDQQAYFKLLSVLQSLAATPYARLPLRADGRPDLRMALLLGLEGESYQIKTEDDAGVQIFEMREIRGMRFRHVYVLGLVDGLMPALPEEGMLVARRREVPALDQQLQGKENEVKHLFTQAFESAGDKLVLAHWTREGDRPATPSPFLVQAETLGSLRPLDRPQLVPSVAEAASRLGMRCVAATDVRRLWPTATGEARPILERMNRSISSWRDRPAARAPIRIELPVLLARLYSADRPFSPSELEQYAACPFRYFGARVLNLGARETDESMFAHGSLLHRVLNKFYQERRRAAGEGKPVPAIGPADRPLILQIYREEWDKEVDGAVSPELLTIFERSNGLLDFFLELMARVEADGGNLWTELPLRVPLGNDAEGREVLLHGTIDRVDGLNHGVKTAGVKTAGVIDYKTGVIVDGKELAAKLGDGRRIQLPLYAAGFEAQHPGWKVTRGLYLHLTARKRSNEKPGAAIVNIGPLQANGTDGAFDTQAAVAMALAFAGRIRAGEFPLTAHPRGTDLHECNSRCPLRHACRHPDGYEVSPWR